MGRHTIGATSTSFLRRMFKGCMSFINQLSMTRGRNASQPSTDGVERKEKRRNYNSRFHSRINSSSQAILDTKHSEIVTCEVSSGSFGHDYWSYWWSIHQDLGQMLQRLGKLNGPRRRIEIIMDMILLPIIFSVWAAISILLLIQSIISRENLLHFTAITTKSFIKYSIGWDSYFGCSFIATQDNSGWQSYVGFS